MVLAGIVAKIAPHRCDRQSTTTIRLWQAHGGCLQLQVPKYSGVPIMQAMSYRIGIDLGGTKTEGILMDAGGDIVRRIRHETPQNYDGIVLALKALTEKLQGSEEIAGVGVAAPGTTTQQGLVKNSNTVLLNGRPFYADVRQALGTHVEFANDADCLALSESIDGAAAGAGVVFAVIIGTGTGGGIVVNSQVTTGKNGIRGEWGHTPLPWPLPTEYPGPSCYCGRKGCIETFVSGPGFANYYASITGIHKTAKQIVADADAGQTDAVAARYRYAHRLARGLAMIINILDPDVIVLGGGMSNIDFLYEQLPTLVHPWVFGGEFSTPIRKAMHGDSSGVRGAAWLSDGNHSMAIPHK